MITKLVKTIEHCGAILEITLVLPWKMLFSVTSEIIEPCECCCTTIVVTSIAMIINVSARGRVGSGNGRISDSLDAELCAVCEGGLIGGNVTSHLRKQGMEHLKVERVDNNIGSLSIVG
jgi:hypothetical protein